MDIANTWSTRIGFLLASIGASVGLGNIWKFPYVAGTNGGASFVIIYILCALVIATPILICELIIGRRSRVNPVSSISYIANEEKISRSWGIFGGLGALSGFIIVSFYSVIAGWALAYSLKAFAGSFSGLTSQSSKLIFNQLLSNPVTLTFWHTIFLLMTTYILSRKISSGIERAAKLLIPALALILLMLSGYALLVGDSAAAMRFLFSFNTEDINGHTFIIASGQAFFSIGVAMGLMMAYGAYLPKKISIGQSALIITAADTLFAIVAGLAIFPLVFASQLDPSSGPGLIFESLPIAFSKIPYGNVFGALFFILLVFAALTSALGLLEPTVSYLTEKHQIDRSLAASLSGIAAWTLGLGTVLSFNRLDSFFPLEIIPSLKQMPIFELLDHLTSNLLMPITAVGISVFCAWRIKKQNLMDELPTKRGIAFDLWYFSARYLAPATIILFLLIGL